MDHARRGIRLSTLLIVVAGYGAVCAGRAARLLWDSRPRLSG